MKLRRYLTVPAVSAAVCAAFAAGASSGLAAGSSGTRTLAGSRPAAASAPSAGAVAGASHIDFAVQLRPRNLTGAQALARAVSTPGSATYGKFLTPAQWEQRFSPTAAQVAAVTAWLRSSGFRVGQVSADRMTVNASGTARQIERAFHSPLSYHRVQGAKVRVNDRALSVPSSLSGFVVAVSGLTQSVARPFNTVDNPSRPAQSTNVNPNPPAGFRVAHPCGAYYNQLIDAALPPFGNGYPANPPWAVCGYTPAQFRSAYNENPAADGTGVTVAIVDAYAAPTLFADAQTYASRNDPSHPLSSSQFSELLVQPFNQGDLCGANGWYGEQTLDVEAVHAMAPGAHVLFVGAKNCLQADLNAAVQKIVDGHLANVITNSYGDPAGDLLDPDSVRNATDNVLLMAAGTGVSVLFSSGDWFDNYTLTGVVAPTYPASSPWATGVGGTTTAIGENGQRMNEWGWSTARSLLCTETVLALGGCTADQLHQWLPIDLGLDGGSGGGTSRVYPQPFYQAGIVPTSLSEKYGDTPMRVEPDISMDADPATGMLVGETQTFPDGVYYDQYRIGGTSLASPLLAGYIATADQMAGHPLGFLNPAIYGISGQSGAINDVQFANKVDQSRADYVNSLNASDGYLFWTRIIGYEGPEQFCATADHCSRIDMTLHATQGYDNLTGLGTPGSNFLGLLSSTAP